jgi:hypothetical protein
LRPAREILATLDEDGCAGGLPFMPEMLEFFGKRLDVRARAERTCDTLTYTGTRHFPDTVILDDLRCDGSGHDGCDARCRFLWRESWLRAAGSGSGTPAPDEDDDGALAELRRRAAAGTKRPPDGPEPVYRCQATELLRASELEQWWSPRALLREVTSGNVGLGRFVSVLSRAVVDQASKRLLRKSFGDGGAPSQPAKPEAAHVDVGQLVQVKSRAEIAATLNENFELRGLKFDVQEMGPYCGQRGRVTGRVRRFIDETTGKMIQLKTDAYVIDGFCCTGEHSTKRWFCQRGIYAWWREAWLTHADESDG